MLDPSLPSSGYASRASSPNHQPPAGALAAEMLSLMESRKFTAAAARFLAVTPSERSTALQWRDSRGDTLLHKAVEVESQSGPVHTTSEVADLILLFLRKRADVNACNRNRQTPIHIAATGGNIDFCKVLIKYGARLDVLDRTDRRPEDVANKCGFQRLAEFLASQRSAAATTHNMMQTSQNKASRVNAEQQAATTATDGLAASANVIAVAAATQAAMSGDSAARFRQDEERRNKERQEMRWQLRSLQERNFDLLQQRQDTQRVIFEDLEEFKRAAVIKEYELADAKLYCAFQHLLETMEQRIQLRCAEQDIQDVRNRLTAACNDNSELGSRVAQLEVTCAELERTAESSAVANATLRETIFALEERNQLHCQRLELEAEAVSWAECRARDAEERMSPLQDERDTAFARMREMEVETAQLLITLDTLRMELSEEQLAREKHATMMQTTQTSLQERLDAQLKENVELQGTISRLVLGQETLNGQLKAMRDHTTQAEQLLHQTLAERKQVEDEHSKKLGLVTAERDRLRRELSEMQAQIPTTSEHAAQEETNRRSSVEKEEAVASLELRNTPTVLPLPSNDVTTTVLPNAETILLREALMLLEENLKTKSAKCDALELDAKRWNEERTMLQQRMAAMHTSAQQDIPSPATPRTTSVSELVIQRQRMNELERDVESAQSTLKQVSAAFEAERAHRESALRSERASREELQHEVGRLQRTLKEREEECLALQQKVEKLHSADVVEEENISLKTTLSEIRSELLMVKGNRQQTLIETHLWRERAEAAEAQREALEQQLARAVGFQSALERSLKETSDSAVDGKLWKAEANRIQAELRETQHTVSVLEKEISRLEETILSLQRKLTSTSAEATTTIHRLALEKLACEEQAWRGVVSLRSVEGWMDVQRDTVLAITQEALDALRRTSSIHSVNKSHQHAVVVTERKHVGGALSTSSSSSYVNSLQRVTAASKRCLDPTADMIDDASSITHSGGALPSLNAPVVSDGRSPPSHVVRTVSALRSHQHEAKVVVGENTINKSNVLRSPHDEALGIIADDSEDVLSVDLVHPPQGSSTNRIIPSAAAAAAPPSEVRGGRNVEEGGSAPLMSAAPQPPLVSHQPNPRMRPMSAALQRPTAPSRDVSCLRTLSSADVHVAIPTDTIFPFSFTTTRGGFTVSDLSRVANVRVFYEQQCMLHGVKPLPNVLQSLPAPDDGHDDNVDHVCVAGGALVEAITADKHKLCRSSARAIIDLLRVCPRLHTLDLSGTCITDSIVTYLVLTVYDVIECPVSNPYGKEEAWKQHAHDRCALKELDLTGTLVSNVEPVAALAAVLPSLTTVCLQECRLLRESSKKIVEEKLLRNAAAGSNFQLHPAPGSAATGVNAFNAHQTLPITVSLSALHLGRTRRPLSASSASVSRAPHQASFLGT